MPRTCRRQLGRWWLLALSAIGLLMFAAAATASASSVAGADTARAAGTSTFGVRTGAATGRTGMGRYVHAARTPLGPATSAGLTQTGMERLLGRPDRGAILGGARAARGSLAGTPSLLSFADVAGDAAGAPDLTEVAINGDAATGTIAITVNAPGNVPAAPDGLVRIVTVWLNTDNNMATGDQGDEYVLQAIDDPADPEHWWAIGRWNGTDWEGVPYAPTMQFNRSGDVLAWTVNKTDLGGATGFAVWVSALTVDPATQTLTAHDLAPDAGTWLYDIAGPTRTMTMSVKPLIGKPVAAPARAKAGKRFAVSFRVTDPTQSKPTPLKSGTMVATPTIGGKVVRHTQSFKAGVARLSLVVPKTAKGKRLKVTVRIKASSHQDESIWIDLATGQTGVMGISYVGQSSTKSVSFQIR